MAPFVHERLCHVIRHLPIWNRPRDRRTGLRRGDAEHPSSVDRRGHAAIAGHRRGNGSEGNSATRPSRVVVVHHTEASGAAMRGHDEETRPRLSRRLRVSNEPAR